VTVSAGTATPVTVTVVQPGVDDCGSSGVAYCSWTLSSYASSSITKKLEVATDEDWIRFTAPIAGSWTFKSSGIPTGSDIYGYLLNSSGSQLAYDDDGAGNRNFSITYTLTANTVYYLKVKNYSATTSTPANPYTITATLPGDECGQNLEDYCAWSLGTAGGTISKGLQYRGDEDYIRFTAPSSGSWTFTSSGIPTGSDIYGHLLNASGTQLTYNDDGAGNRNFKITYTLTAGSVYYLRVRNYSTGTSVPANPYTITATKG
jgi:protein involved in ribonucleotide reduction